MRYHFLLVTFLAVPLSAQDPLAYRQLWPGMSLAAFTERANRMATSQLVRCRTSVRTAQLMECGVRVAHDDGSTPYVAVYVIAGTVAMLSVTDSGGPPLVAKWRSRLTNAYGTGTTTRRSMLEWVKGGVVARLTWRGRGDRRWVALTITHQATLAKITDYLPRSPRP